MVKSNWKWYPIIGAGTCLLITIIYFYLIFNIKTSVPPSSTDGLKYIVSSFISIVNGGIGYVVSLFLGNIFERTISKKYSDKFIKKSNFILSVIITILFCSILIPYTVKSYNSEKQLIHEWDVKNHLGVKLNTGKIIKVAIRLDEISKDTNQKNESHLLTSESEHGSFLLNGVKYQIKFKSPDIFLHDSDGNTFLKYSL